METKKINLDFSKPWNLNDILQCYLVVHAKLCLIELTKPIQQACLFFISIVETSEWVGHVGGV